MITLKDLAKELNLSISTVSKALNDSYEISETTRSKVKKLAKLKNYKRNKAAVSLRKRKTKTIGVIIPNILNPFFARLLHNIENSAAKYDYSIIICISNESLEKEKKSIALLTDGSVDGILISVTKETQTLNEVAHLKEVMNSNIPMVMVDRVVNSIECDKVITNDYKAVFQATNYLIKEGRKNILLLNSLNGLNANKIRANAYEDAIKQSKKYLKKPLIIAIENNDYVDINLSKALKKHNNVDAVIAIDYTLGEVALNALKNAGKQIPKEVSVIGFSSKHIIILTNPKLSTIAQQSRQIAKEAAHTLIKKIEEKTNSQSKTIIINTKLEHRESTTYHKQPY